MPTTTNLFDIAKTVSPAKGKKPATKTFVETEGLELVGAIDHTIKWLESLKETAMLPVKEAATERFIDLGIITGTQPESYDGREGQVTANIQCKKRASNSGLSDIEKAICDEHNVPLGTSGGEYFFPKEHQGWVEENGTKISKALQKIPGCPVGIIAKNPTKDIATDDSIPFILKQFKAQRDIIEKLLPMVAVVATKPKFGAALDEEERNSAALAVIQKFLNGEEG